jgi:hypothetical protein
MTCGTAPTGAHDGTRIVRMTRLLSDTIGTTTGNCFIAFLITTAMECPNKAAVVLPVPVVSVAVTSVQLGAFCQPFQADATTNSWARVLPEKFGGSQLIKKLPTFYGTRGFITEFTRTSHLFLSRARPIQSMTPSPFMNSHFNIILPSVPRSSLRFSHRTEPLPHACYMPSPGTCHASQ